MVAVVSGSGLGLFNSSTSTLGGAGANGNSQVGRGRDQVYVNSTTGNLIVQSVDETLSALGLDFAGVRTYNSQGLTDEDNGDQWRLGVHQRIYNLVGAVNSANSTITKVFGDGAEVVYTWNSTRSRYESNEGDGANDYLIWNGTGSAWTWTDGSSRSTEEYGLIEGVQRIRFSRDADGNTVTYNYSGSLLTRGVAATGPMILEEASHPMPAFRVAERDKKSALQGCQLATRGQWGGAVRTRPGHRGDSALERH